MLQTPASVFKHAVLESHELVPLLLLTWWVDQVNSDVLCARVVSWIDSFTCFFFPACSHPHARSRTWHSSNCWCGSQAPHLTPGPGNPCCISRPMHSCSLEAAKRAEKQVTMPGWRLARSCRLTQSCSSYYCFYIYITSQFSQIQILDGQDLIMVSSKVLLHKFCFTLWRQRLTRREEGPG
jgi:hypothetical protein